MTTICRTSKYNGQKYRLAPYIEKIMSENSEAINLASEFGRSLSQRYDFSDALLEDALNVFMNTTKANAEDKGRIKELIKNEFENSKKEAPSDNYSKVIQKYISERLIIDYRNQEFKLALKNALYIDITSDDIPLHKRKVDNIRSLNYHAEMLFESWFKDILDYYGEEGELFDANHERTILSHDILNKFYLKIEELPNIQEYIYDSYSSYLKGNNDESAKFFKAFNSYLNLVYFDTLLLNSIKSISINQNQRNPILLSKNELGKETPFYKYTFKKYRTDLNKGEYNTKDSIKDVLEDMGGEVQSIIESIPVYDYYSGVRVESGGKLTKPLFAQSIFTLFDILNSCEDDEKVGISEIKKLLDNLPSNPDNVRKILDYIFENKDENNRFRKYLLNPTGTVSKMTEQTLNILFSFREGMWTNPKSYLKIENAYYKKNGITNNSDAVAAVLLYIVSSVKMRYAQSEFDHNYNRFMLSQIPETNSRQNLFNLKSSINASIAKTPRDKTSIVENFGFECNGESILVKLSGLSDNEDLVIRLNLKNKHKSIFTERSTDYINQIVVDSTNESLYNYFKDIINDLETSVGINKTLSNKNEDNKTKLFFSLLSMFDELFHTNFSSGKEGLDKIDFILRCPDVRSIQAKQAYFHGMIYSAIKAISLLDLYSDMETNEQYLNDRDLVAYLKENDWHGISIEYSNEKLKKSTSEYLTEKRFNLLGDSDFWTTGYQYALDMIQSNFDKSVINDPAGNKQAKYSSIYMAAKYKYRVQEIMTNQNDICKDLLFMDFSDAIRGCITDTYVTVNDIQKPILDLNEIELYTHDIFDSFFSLLTIKSADLAKNVPLPPKIVYIKPFCVADKKKMPVYIVDLSKIKIDDTDLWKLKSKEGLQKVLLKLYENFKSYYEKMVNNTVNKYSRILKGEKEDKTPISLMNLNEIQKEIKSYKNKYELIKKAQDLGIVLVENVDYIIVDGKAELNPLILYYFKRVLQNFESFSQELNRQKQNLISDLNKKKVKFDRNNRVLNINRAVEFFVSDNSDYNENTFNQKWFEGSILKIANGEELNPLLDYYFTISSLLQNNLRLMMFDSEVSHTVKRYGKVNEMSLSDAILSGKDIGNPEFDEEIRKVKKEAIVASTKRAGTMSSTVIPVKQQQLNGVARKLNTAIIDDIEAAVYTPDIKKRKQKVHDGGGFITFILKILEDNSLHENAVGYIRKPMLGWHNPETGSSTQFKYAINTLSNRFMRNSVGCKYDTYNLFRKMTNILPFTVDEINLVYNFFNGEGVGKVTDVIDQNKFQRTIIGVERGAYYWKLNEKGQKEYRKIITLGFDADKKCYYTIELRSSFSGKKLNAKDSNIKEYHVFDNVGNRLNKGKDGKIEEGQHTISTIFELYQALGGLNSLEISNDLLVESEISQEMVAGFLNNVVNIKGEIKAYTQEYIEQPLKTRMIHCVLPSSAVKDGAGNVNSSDVLSNANDLTYMSVDTTHYGPQNDSDHEADESETTEPTLVIGAVDVGGTMHDENEIFYNVVGEAIKLFATTEFNAVSEYINDHTKTNKLYRHLALLLVDNFDPNKQNGGIGLNIINKIDKELNKFYDQTKVRIHFPFSDPNIYSILVSTVTSKLNNTAIKKTFSGGGMPMAPSYGYRQLYDINGITYLFLDILNYLLDRKNAKILLDLYAKKGSFYANLNGANLNRELVKDYLYNLLYDSVKNYFANPTTVQSPFIDKDDINPSDVIHFYVNDTPINEYEGYAFNDLETYYTFIADPGAFVSQLYNIQVETGLLRYLKSIITPRDLAPDKMIVKLTDGQKINLYNFPIVTERFKLLNVKTLKEFKEFIERFNEEYKLWNYKLPVSLTKQSFPEVYRDFQNYLQTIYDKLTKDIEDKHKYTNGKEVFDVDSIVKVDHEGLFPAIYASKYGITSRDSIADILKEGPERFRHTYGKQKTISLNYHIKFTSSSPKVDEIYISFDDIEIDSSTRKVNWKDSKEEYDKFYTEFLKPGKNRILYQKVWYQLDYEEKFLVGVQMLDKKISVGEDGLYRNNKGEVLNNKSKRYSTIVIDGNKYALEYIPLVNLYEVLEAENRYKLYNIKVDNIKSVSSWLEGNVDEVIGSILNRMYQVDDYESVYIKDSITGKMIEPMSRYIASFSNRLNYNTELKLYLDLISLFFANRKVTKEEENKFIDLSKETDTNGRTIEEYFDDYDIKRCQYMFSSFLKSLEFVVTRIPSQTLQSFMKMRSAGFTNSDSNECYVSHILLFLQGSDFDYDKAYTIGFSISNSGKFVGWSNLFNYSTLETLNKSLELPIALKRVAVINGTKTNDDLVPYVQELRNALDSGNEIEILDKEIKLIKYIDKRYLNNRNEKGKTPEIFIVDNEIVRLLQSHYNTTLVSNSIKEDMLRNYIVNHIGKVITYMPNFLRAHNPVAMEAIRGSIDYAEVKDEQELSFLNPTTILRMQFKNMVGKKATGISANGEKVSFYWNYYFRHKIKYKRVRENTKGLRYSESPFFSFEANRIVGRASHNMQKSNIIECLPDINLDNFVDSNYDLLFTRFIENIKAKRKLKGKYTPDDLISLLLSASTDNAKELILEKINGNVDLLKCHLLLFSLGIDVEDVVAFMTSPALTWIADVTQGDIYEGTGLSLHKAIGLITGKGTSGYTDEGEDLYEGIDDESAATIYFAPKVTAPTAQDYAEMNTTPLEFKDDIKQFETVLNAANEFTSFATLLRMNQGIPGKDYNDLVNYFSRIKMIIKNAEYVKGESLENIRKEFFNPLNEYSEENIKEADYLISKNLISLQSDVFDFNMDLWLNNKVYRKLIASYYEKLKSVVNVFDAINTIPNYKSMFETLSVANTILESNVLKVRMHKLIFLDLSDANILLTDYLNKKITKYIDEKLILRFISRANISIPTNSNYSVFNGFWTKTRLDQDLLTINDVMSAANFKYLFEEELITMLLAGKYYDYDKETGEVILKENLSIASNEFIKNVMKDVDINGSPILKLRLDMSNSSKRYLSPDYLADIHNLKKAFSELSKIEFGEVNPFLGRKLNISDLFVLYNLIVNKNRYGRNTFTALFDSSDTKLLLDAYLTDLGELERLNTNDFVTELGYEFNDFLMSAAKKSKSVNNSITEPVIYVDQGGNRTYYIKKAFGSFKKLEGVPTEIGVNEKDRLEKIENIMSYGVLSSNFSQYITGALIHLDLNNMFGKDINKVNREEHLKYAVKFISDRIADGNLVISIKC